MHKSVVMVLAMSAGLASGAFGQNYTYESRLVLDNDPLLAQIGVDYGTRALLPGASATAVGVTLVVRVTSNGTFPNYGVNSVYNYTTGSSATSQVARITHSDAISNQTNAMWTSPSLAFARGYIDATSSNRGVMATGVNLRGGVTGFDATTTAEMNSAQQNPASAGTSRPLDLPTNGPSGPYPLAGATFTAGGSRNGNGWIGPIGVAGTPGQIAGIFATAAGTLNGPGVNYQSNDQDATTDGAQAPWQAVYHFVFTPRTASGTNIPDPTRTVTVNFTGGVRAAVVNTYGNIGGGITSAQNPSTLINPSLTFLVPGPASGTLIALVGLVASRRRRG